MENIVKRIGGIFWIAVLTVLLFVVGVWVLSYVKKLPVAGPVVEKIEGIGHIGG